MSINQFSNPITGTQPTRTPSTQQLPGTGNNYSQGGYTFVFQPAKGATQEITLVVNPEEYVQTESSTSNVILTAGDIFSDSFGPGLTEIKISGTFGQRPLVNGAVGSGQLQVLQLRNLFRQYLDQINPIITQDATSNSGAKLFFYNPKDNEFWQIEPVGRYFTLKRSKTSPFLYRYELSFVAMSRVTNSAFLEALSFYYNVQDQLSNITGTAENYLIAQTSNPNIPILMSLINPTLFMPVGFTPVVSATSSPQNYFQNAIATPLTNLVTAVDNFLNSTTSVIDYPLNGITDIQTNCRSILDGIFGGDINKGFLGNGLFTYNPSTNTYTPSNLYDPAYENSLVNFLSATELYSLYSNNFVKIYSKTDFVNQTVAPVDTSIEYINLQDVKSVIYYQIRNDDTIESIAARTLGDSTQWKVLAEFNNLAYPYISSNFEDKTLTPGQQIAIPQTQIGTSSTNIVLSSYQTPPTSDSPFGSDFYLDSTGDLDIASSGDILTVSGIPNMEQAIRLKLNIYRGELLAHLDFGTVDFRGYRTLSLLAASANSQLQATILSDSRVSGITNSSVTINGDIVNYEVGVNLKFTSQPAILNGSFGG